MRTKEEKHAYDALYYVTHREQIRARNNRYMREYYIKNWDKLRAKTRKYIMTHPEQNKQWQKVYRLRHKEEINKNQKKNYSKYSLKKNAWGVKNRKRLVAKKMERYYNDEKFRITELLRGRLLHALKLYGEGKRFKSVYYGVDFKAIIGHLGSIPNDGQKYHIDHIRPLCSFDLTKPKEIKKAFAPENHQWLEARDNLSKGAKWNGDN